MPQLPLIFVLAFSVFPYEPAHLRTCMLLSQVMGIMLKRGVHNTAWQERFFVLWRHPDLISGDYTLFWFESETDQIHEIILLMVEL